MHDRTYSSNIGVTALRRVGEASSFMINAGFADSRQVTDTQMILIAIVFHLLLILPSEIKVSAHHYL